MVTKKINRFKMLKLYKQPVLAFVSFDLQVLFDVLAELEQDPWAVVHAAAQEATVAVAAVHV